MRRGRRGGRGYRTSHAQHQPSTNPASTRAPSSATTCWPSTVTYSTRQVSQTPLTATRMRTRVSAVRKHRPEWRHPMVTLPVYLDYPVTQLRRYSATNVSPAELRALLIEDNIPGITGDTASGHVYAAVSAILASNAQVLLRELDRQAGL